MEKRVAILGATKGIGRALAQTIHGEGHRILCCGRTQVLLEKLKAWGGVDIHQWDASQPKELEALVSVLKIFRPTHLIYCAGGGPYGFFSSKEWKDHRWAMAVNFETPAQLIHMWLQDRFEGLEQVICIGSAIAEGRGDPKSASYAAAKHALKGLVTSLQKETNRDLRLLSPSYVDTTLLPRKASPHNSGEVLLTPLEVAVKLWQWSGEPAVKKHFIVDGTH